MNGSPLGLKASPGKNLLCKWAPEALVEMIFGWFWEGKKTSILANWFYCDPIRVFIHYHLT